MHDGDVRREAEVWIRSKSRMTGRSFPCYLYFKSCALFSAPLLMPCCLQYMYTTVVVSLLPTTLTQLLSCVFKYGNRYSAPEVLRMQAIMICVICLCVHAGDCHESL
jgi:hypothetical protein